jgi:hypothetical protein
MKATLASCLAMQLTLGAGCMVSADGADGVTGDEPAVVETIARYSQGQDQGDHMKRDIVLAGFFLTAEEWQSFDPAARAQLIAAASYC